MKPKAGTYSGKVLKLALCCRHFVNRQGLSLRQAMDGSKVSSGLKGLYERAIMLTIGI